MDFTNKSDGISQTGTISELLDWLGILEDDRGVTDSAEVIGFARDELRRENND